MSATPEDEGCPSNGQPAPEPAGGELVGDFDGDGASDRVVLADGVLTFATASGYVAGLQLDDPTTRALAVADPQEDGQTYVFLATNRTPPESFPVHAVRLASLIECEPTIVTDVDGEQYVIEHTQDESGGLGFGCTDADDDGDRELVGLVQTFSEEQETFERTVIELDGGVASNGATDSGEIPEGSSAPLASCGNQVFELG